MKNKGYTLLEVLISITLVGIIMLFLIKIMNSLENINYDSTYASSDEINRTTIIKNIEHDFLTNKLKGININNNEIVFKYIDHEDILKIENDKLIYKGEAYSLKSANASYDKCAVYSYTTLNNGYYYVVLRIPVLINKKNTTIDDDIVLSYLGIKDVNTNYMLEYNC